MKTDHAVIGKTGRVTGEITPGDGGEVVINIRGGVETFYAYSEAPTLTIPKNTKVVVTAFMPPRTLTVRPLDA